MLSELRHSQADKPRIFLPGSPPNFCREAAADIGVGDQTRTIFTPASCLNLCFWKTVWNTVFWLYILGGWSQEYGGKEPLGKVHSWGYLGIRSKKAVASYVLAQGQSSTGKVGWLPQRASNKKKKKTDTEHGRSLEALAVPQNPDLQHYKSRKSENKLNSSYQSRVKVPSYEKLSLIWNLCNMDLKPHVMRTPTCIFLALLPCRTFLFKPLQFARSSLWLTWSF